VFLVSGLCWCGARVCQCCQTAQHNDTPANVIFSSVFTDDVSARNPCVHAITHTHTRHARTHLIDNLFELSRAHSGTADLVLAHRPGLGVRLVVVVVVVDLLARVLHT
jgi:hypothetical protein